MPSKPGLTIYPSRKQPPTRDHKGEDSVKEALPLANSTRSHPTKPTSSDVNAKLFFVGTATTILEWEGLRLMTDPNFLHAGDHVHLGPGVIAQRQTDPAVDLHDLPHIDLVLLSHYHADHFDQLVEASLRRDLPIITTPHAKSHLSSKGDGESFTNVHAVDAWDDMFVNIDSQSATSNSSKKPRLRVTGMPGKHVPDGMISKVNDLLGAVPPTNGWMLELGYFTGTDDFECSYRIYISGDTLFVKDLEKIPELYTHANKPIDLMLLHLGGTTIPSKKTPLIMVTMDAVQGVKLVQLVQPDLTMPIHYDDYDLFLTPLSEFKTEMSKAGLDNKVVYLARGDEFAFQVK